MQPIFGYHGRKPVARNAEALDGYDFGEIRLKEGSFVKEAKKLQLEFRPDPGDDKFLLEESGFKIEDRKRGEQKMPPAEKPSSKKPKGFL